MSHGFHIVNKRNQHIILGQEESMILWGAYSTRIQPRLYPSLLDNYYDLGNIPKEAEPVAYFTINWGGNSSGSGFVDVFAGMRLRAGHGNKMYLNIASWYTNQKRHPVDLKIYVFVKARFKPLEDYGIALYNDSNVLAYHSGGELMVVHGVAKQSWRFGSFGGPYQESRHWGTYAYALQRSWAHAYFNNQQYIKCVNSVFEPYIPLSVYRNVPLRAI